MASCSDGAPETQTGDFRRANGRSVSSAGFQPVKCAVSLARFRPGSGRGKSKKAPLFPPVVRETSGEGDKRPYRTLPGSAGNKRVCEGFQISMAVSGSVSGKAAFRSAVGGGSQKKSKTTPCTVEFKCALNYAPKQTKGFASPARLLNLPA